MLARLIAAASLFSVCAIALADKSVMVFRIGGSDVGGNSVEIGDDGSFSGWGELKVSGVKLRVEATGGPGFTLVRSSTVSEQPSGQTTIVIESGKVRVSQPNKKLQELPLPKLPAEMLSNLMPQLLMTVIGKYDAAKRGEQTFTAFLIDGATFLKIKLSPGAPRPLERDGKRLMLETWKTKVGPVEATVISELRGKINRVVGLDVPSQLLQMFEVGYEGLFVDPVDAYKELSPSIYRAKTVSGVRMKMRDGVQLVADIVMPDTVGKWPVLLMRTPYGRAVQMIGGRAEWWAKRGYAVVVQDSRGRHDSEGAWDPFMYERKDGYDTIDWISKQPWCDGNVGMIGASYGGGVQWQAAVERHPALKCIVPQVSPPDPMFNLPYDYGVVALLANTWWTNIVKEKVTTLENAALGLKRVDLLTTLPLSKVDDAVLGGNVPFFDTWLKRQTSRDWTGWNYQADLKNVRIPALMISGWWDGDGIGTKLNWERMRALGRKNQWLIYGPWPHGFNAGPTFADMNYGPDSVLELDSLYLRWFDTWLKKKDVGLTQVPRARIFVTGENKWREFDDWPPKSSREEVLYLGAKTPAIGPQSGGTLSAKPGTDRPSKYTFNPAVADIPKELLKPDAELATTIVPKSMLGKDTLLFMSESLTDAKTVLGPVSLDLWFSSNARDCDLFFAVVDVLPNGDLRMIGMPGKLRASYRNGFDRRVPLEKNAIYKVTLNHWDVAHKFEKGHRIGLLLTSGMFPMYARNLGLMEPDATATRMVSQTQTIYHDLRRPSALRYRLLP